MNTNPILLTDSYKISHWQQYPEGTTNIYSYFESRGGKFDHVVFFGLQYILKTYLQRKITVEDIDEAEEIFSGHFGSTNIFNRPDWQRIVDEHDGYFPAIIKAVPEGSRIPVSNVLMTVENTDPSMPWVTNYIETILSQVWYPSTVATLSNEVHRMISAFLEATGDPAGVDFKLHDFGFRGVSSLESAAIGGAAHLINFLGTDTIPAMTFLRDYYGAEGPTGFSIPASEHSTITSWGQDNEVEAYRNMVEKFGGMPFYAVVSDSYNIYDAAKHLWGEELKTEVLNAEGTLVVRPDSGPPTTVTAALIEILGDKFGFDVNEKGYKVLNPKVRMIWGDGLDIQKIYDILLTLKNNGWSADNIAFGMGGGLLQQVNRDTQKFAFKCSSAIINGEEIIVFKDPVTDKGKISKRGRLALVNRGGQFSTPSINDLRAFENNLLKTIYLNGKLLNTTTLTEIKERVND